MYRPRSLFSLLIVILAPLAGCQSARVVKVDPAGGVVAIPENTNVWPTYYRDKAEALLRERFPNGYVVMQEEEYVKGQQAHTNSHTDTDEKPTLLLGGSDTSTKKKGNGIKQTSGFGGLAIPLGETQQRTQETTTYTDITEYRISVRAK